MLNKTLASFEIRGGDIISWNP